MRMSPTVQHRTLSISVRNFQAVQYKRACPAHRQITHFDDVRFCNKKYVYRRASMRIPSEASHFPPKLREAACESYFHAYSSVHGVQLDCRQLPELRLGPAGDAVLTKAYQSFMAAHSRRGRLIGCPRPCSRKAYRELIHRHFNSWARTRECPTRSRKKPVSLTDAEATELAQLLATPMRIGNSYIRFTTLEEAGEIRPRVRSLVLKSGVSHQALHAWLLSHVSALKYKPEDRAPILCASTLRQRQILCDVLGHRRPWFTRLSHRAAIAHNDGAAFAQPIVSPSPTEHTLVNVYFEHIFYSLFTFVIDAATFTDQEGEMHEHPKCYSLTNDVFPPHLVPGDRPISQTRSLMVYAVIHKHGGLVVGPDIMLTGSKLEKSKVPKAQQLAQAGVETW